MDHTDSLERKLVEEWKDYGFRFDEWYLPCVAYSDDIEILASKTVVGLDIELDCNGESVAGTRIHAGGVWTIQFTFVGTVWPVVLSVFLQLVTQISATVDAGLGRSWSHRCPTR